MAVRIQECDELRGYIKEKLQLTHKKNQESKNNLDYTRTLLLEARKIKQLEDILITLLQLIDLLNITINVSVLGYSSTSGSVDDLAQALVQSGNQPGNSPFGLHSGMVLTFGGPGQGFIAAFQALAFIMSAGQFQ